MSIKRSDVLAAAKRLPLPPEMLAYSRAPLLLALYYRGRLDEAVACMEEGLQLCDPVDYSRAFHVWSDHGVSMLGYLALTSLYGITYVAFVLLAGVIIFSRRDFK